MTLVAPCWVKQAWFPDVLDLLVDHPRNLLWQTYLPRVFCRSLNVSPADRLEALNILLRAKGLPVDLSSRVARRTRDSTTKVCQS